MSCAAFSRQFQKFWVIILAIFLIASYQNSHCFAKDSVSQHIGGEKGHYVVPRTLFRLGHEEKKLLALLKKAIFTSPSKADVEGDLRSQIAKVSFQKKIYGVSVCLYRSGVPRILVLRRKRELLDGIVSVIEGVKAHPRFKDFIGKNLKDVRLQVDLLTTQLEPIQLNQLSTEAIGPERFEFGIDGLLVSSGAKSLYFLPGDAFVRSRLGFNQLDRNLRVQMQLDQQAIMSYKRYRTISFIDYKNTWLELYRGYPFPWKLSKEDIRKSALAGARHIADNQNPDGSFLYYYNAAKDSYVDHEHPKRDPKVNRYYNILRHVAAVPLLIHYYRSTKDSALLQKIEKALWFGVSHLKKHQLPNGATGMYVYQYKKAKLGAAGVFLYALVEYEKLTKNKKFSAYAEGLAQHLLHQILPTGEFVYYSIINDQEIKPEDNSKNFNFYYPGEALLGLAAYLDENKNTIKNSEAFNRKLHDALNFLIYERPKIYATQFPALPEDAWVIMAIERLWNVSEFKKEEYKKFAFASADLVTKQMYTAESGLYPDYPGGFFYVFGDHTFPDGARGEGVVAALKLAKKIGDEAKVNQYKSAIQLICRSLYFLVNTDQSIYSVPNPKKTKGGIRFKLTRQWFRIDTIAHVANVYFDFINDWSDAADKEYVKKIFASFKNQKSKSKSNRSAASLEELIHMSTRIPKKARMTTP